MPNILDALPWSATRGRELLEKVADGRPLAAVYRTGTRWDVGHWFHDAVVWAGLCEGELLLCAAGRKPLAERIPLPALAESAYNAITGEVFFAPVRGAKLAAVALPPVEGEALAAALRGGGSSGRPDAA
ncbi:MAG: hypothetical protein ACOX5G_11270 [Kiritimatiellia bacterium]|jgi:hypothetical protein